MAVKNPQPSSDPVSNPRQEPVSNCLVETVVEVMAAEPSVEAVRVNRKVHSISVATLGQPRSPSLESDLSDRIKKLQAQGDHGCALLDGAPDCGHCAARKSPAPTPNLSVDHSPDVTTIARITCPTAPTFWRWRDIAWPKIVPREIVLPSDDHHADEWKMQLVAAAVCGVTALTAHALGGSGWSLVLYLVAYVAGGWFAAEEVFEGMRRRTLDVHFLMLAVAVGSASIGAWGEGSMLLFLFALSGGLEHFAMGRTQREIQSLFKSAPKLATLVDASGGETTIPTDQVRKGMRLMIKPGEQFPVDAEIARGKTAADESNLTGEAVPVDKTIGDSVLAGTLTLWGAVEVVVLRPAGQSALEKIVNLIKEAQHLKAPSQRFTDKFGTQYTYAALGLTLAMFLWWWLGRGLPAFVSTETSKSAFYRAMTLLVVASPCALMLSIPSAILAAIASAAKRGILFRGGAAVEMLAEIDTVAMDKTGTLTSGELRVDAVTSHPAGREREVLGLAFALENLSTHPLARAISKHAKNAGVELRTVDQFESVSGQGLLGRVGGMDVRLGKREWVFDGRGPVELGEQDSKPLEPGCSEVWIRFGEALGRITLRDDLRPAAKPLIQELHRKGIGTLVLTGDREASARLLREELGIREVRSELSPGQKLEAIKAIMDRGGKVAMIGDGVNDAPSLAAAHVGVAMGARGSDAALEQAEVVLMHDRLENFVAAWDISHRARGVIRQNLAISLGTVVVLVLGAIAGVIPLTLGVIGHEGSTVLVVMNSLRLLFFKPNGSAH